MAVVVDKNYLAAVDKSRLLLDGLLEQHAPAFLRLALHDALTWDASSRTGGANGSIRTDKERAHAGNEGLGEVLAALEAVHAQCAPLTFADLCQLAGAAAAASLGGPQIEFRPGRRDSKVSPPEGRLPAFRNCADPASLLQRLARAGLSKRQAVALCGAHPFARWWSAPETYEQLQPALEGSSPRANRPPPAFDASIFREILEDQDPLSRHLGQDPECRIIMRGYAADPQLWLEDYADAFQQLSEAPAGLKPRRRRGAGAGAGAGAFGALSTAATAGVVVAAAVVVAAGAWWVRRRRRGGGVAVAAQPVPNWRS